MSIQLAPVKEDSHSQFVTVRIAGQLFGLPIWAVHDVFVPQRITPVPLAPNEVDGVLNLRGRIVTAINMRRRLGFPLRGDGESIVAVGIDYQGEVYGLLVDEVGEVLTLEKAQLTEKPPNLDQRWSAMTDGVFRLEAELLAVLDVESVLASIREDHVAS
ncbi:chemotaxis protein CheW [Pseudochelatococcus sp. G4_1912]|jgi:purine-binding chemotaxis protein CheW|uniref:chemotaxis protein CheW n=1 Tax=Pseudochelatococcus sp. G4_1912 TaxID=3114288 RepID=UPI0039C6C2EC